MDEVSKAKRKGARKPPVASEAYVPHKLAEVKADAKQRKAQKKLAALDAFAWDRACNEVTAAILSDQVHQNLAAEFDAALVLNTIRGRIDEAKVELGEHRTDAVDCQCRHHALIAAGANAHKRATGVYPVAYCDGIRVMLDRYLARRS